MISLVTTIFNDRFGLEKFFLAMAEQTHLPDEIVIVDAGSKDGTWELMQAEASRSDRPWKIKAIQELRCNVARGRNLAIEASEGALIVSTDIGCDWDPEWLEELVTPFQNDSSVELVVGSWAVKKQDLTGPWAITEWALKGDQRLEATEESYSSSRSIAYRRYVWKALGKYPEDLTLAADDAMFQYLIEMAEVKRVGAPVVRCYWHRHASLQGFFKEAYRYGLGDGEAGIRGKDVLLIGGRMAMEALFLIFGLVYLLPVAPFYPWLGITLVFIALFSFGAKIVKMKTALTRLKDAKISHPLLCIIAYTYGTKWHWIRGYFSGLKRGKVHCLDCRRRLQKMSPSLYKSNLASLAH